MKRTQLIGLIAALAIAGNAAAASCSGGNLSAYKGKFVYNDVKVSTQKATKNWSVTVSFDRAVKIEKIWGAKLTKVNSKTYKVSNLAGTKLATNGKTSFGLKGTNGGKVKSVKCKASASTNKPTANKPKPKPVSKPKPKPVAKPKPKPGSKPVGSVGNSANNAGWVWYEDVDNLATGSMAGKKWKELWGSPFINGDEDGKLRYAVDDKKGLYGEGKSLRIFYPKGGKRSKESGAQWFTEFGPNRNEMYLSYWVYFPKDFLWMKFGGKLPGLAASKSFEDMDERTEGRMMWRPNGLAEFYLHVTGVEDRQLQWDTEKGGQVYFKRGQWHNIEMRYVMNTIKNGKPQANGILEGWLDGKRAGYYDDVVLRTSADVGFNHLQFSTFYGGGSKPGTAPTSDQYAWFDDFIISETPIKAYPGYTPK